MTYDRQIRIDTYKLDWLEIVSLKINYVNIEFSKTWNIYQGKGDSILYFSDVINTVINWYKKIEFDKIAKIIWNNKVVILNKKCILTGYVFYLCILFIISSLNIFLIYSIWFYGVDVNTISMVLGNTPRTVMKHYIISSNKNYDACDIADCAVNGYIVKTNNLYFNRTYLSRKE